jgi:hypothetical protein
MSTVTDIEAALPTLSSEELRHVEAVLRRIQSGRSSERPWMELAGCLSGEAEELSRIGRMVKEEFERVDPEDWR